MDSRVRLIVNLTMAILVIAVAFLAASSLGNFASKKIVEKTPYAVAKITADAKKTAVPEDQSENLAYNRNMFNMKAMESAEEPMPEPSVEEEVTEIIQEITADGKRPILTDLRVMLKGTQVASNPLYSVAMFMPLDGSNVRMQYLKEGDKLLDEATILRIVRNRVYLIRFSQNDRLEYIDTRTTENELNEAKKINEKLKVAEPKPAADPKPTAAATASGINPDTIRKVAADTYEVPRATLEQIRKNPNILKDPKYGAMPKIQPVYKGGAVGGFRVLGVETDSIYGQLGIKSGDTILDINGQQVDNPQKAMSFFDSLQPDQNITIKLNRAGSEKTLTFQLK